MLMDLFLNTKNIHSHEFQRKPSLMPFTSTVNPRFLWLRNVFLQYFEDRISSIKQWDGNFSRKEKNKIITANIRRAENH